MLDEKLPAVTDSRHCLRYIPEQVASTIYFEAIWSNEIYNVTLPMKQKMQQDLTTFLLV